MTETPCGDVSIVVPAYAEERRIGATVRALLALAKEFPRLVEVIVVVEPGTDRTADVAREAAVGSALVTVYERSGRRGKGAAVREGMLMARGEIVFFMDADLSVPLRHVPLFVSHLDAHSETDVVMGDRRHPQSVICVRQNFFRERAGRIFNCVVRLLRLSRSKDTQCGFKAFRREAAREIFSRTRLDGFSFDVEALFIARHLGLRTDELPVEWINGSDTKFQVCSDGWRSFGDLLRVRCARKGK